MAQAGRGDFGQILKGGGAQLADKDDLGRFFPMILVATPPAPGGGAFPEGGTGQVVLLADRGAGYAGEIVAPRALPGFGAGMDLGLDVRHGSVLSQQTP